MPDLEPEAENILPSGIRNHLLKKRLLRCLVSIQAFIHGNIKVMVRLFIFNDTGTL